MGLSAHGKPALELRILVVAGNCWKTPCPRWRPFGDARRFLMPAKQKSRALVPKTTNRMHGTKPRGAELG
jgi:hypothetical protein